MVMVESKQRTLENAGQLKVAYIMSRFPKLTETFILTEMLALEQDGVQVEIFPLLRERDTRIHEEGAPGWKKIVELMFPSRSKPMMHPEAAAQVQRAHFQPFISWRIVQAHIRYLARQPRTYLNTLWTLVRANGGSFNFLIGALAIFPKTVYFAHVMATDGITHVHAHFANHPAAAAFVIHRMTGLPYSFTAHGADLQVDQHMLREKVTDAAFVVAISEYNREFILNLCGDRFRDKTIVIHCGVDIELFSPNLARDGHGQPGRSFKILCIGTMYEVKGHTYLIEACRLLQERGIDLECDFIGDGPDLTTLTQQVMDGRLENRVHFQGRRTRQEIVEFLGNADVLVVPSVPTREGRREGIPVVLMEAMASGVPVIASDISGIPELVEHGKSGLLVPPRNAQVLANNLEALWKDPVERGRLADAGRAKVMEEFNLDKNASELTRHFRGEI
jgi:glycosyltransferase involved in cell wall biosynthesis